MQFVLTRAKHYKRFDLSDYSYIRNYFDTKEEFIPYKEWERDVTDLDGYWVTKINLDTTEDMYRLQKTIDVDIIFRRNYYNECDYVELPTLVIYDDYIE